MKRIKLAFLFSSAVILIVTAAAKFYTAMGSIKLLGTPDPLLQIDYQILLPLVGAVESVVAMVVLFSRTDRLKYLSLLWLSLNFMFYRVGFWLIGLPVKLCPCLGNLTDVFHVKPEAVEAVLRGLVLYLFIGSVIGLLSCRATARGPNQRGVSPVNLGMVP